MAREPSALDSAEEMMREQALRSVALAIKSGADLMVKNPRRILMALYPFAAWTWPHPDKSTVELLCECRQTIRVEVDRARRGWFPDENALLALRSAEEALVQLLAAPLAEAEKAAREVA